MIESIISITMASLLSATLYEYPDFTYNSSSIEFFDEAFMPKYDFESEIHWPINTDPITIIQNKDETTIVSEDHKTLGAESMTWPCHNIVNNLASVAMREEVHFVAVYCHDRKGKVHKYKPKDFTPWDLQ